MLITKIKFLVKKILHYKNWIFFRLFAVIPVKKNKIVFVGGNSFSERPKFVYDELIKLYKNFDIVCCLSNINDKYENVRIVKNGSILSIYELVTAKVWITDGRQEDYFRKRKNQYYVMTWHGGGALKYIEKDAADTLPESYIKCAKNDSKNIDLMVAETEHIYRIMKRAFWYDGEILKKRFINKNLNVKRVCESLNLDTNKSIILYIPTFRENRDSGYYKLKYEEILDKLNEKLKRNYIFIIRFHENNSYHVNDIKYNFRVINGSKYDSIDELIMAADFVITDYSACLFECYRLHKKVIIYAPDYKEYITNERGMYFDIMKMPSPIAQAENELVRSIIDYDENKYHDPQKKINDLIGFYGDDAAKEIAEKIFAYMRE